MVATDVGLQIVKIRRGLAFAALAATVIAGIFACSEQAPEASTEQPLSNVSSGESAASSASVEARGSGAEGVPAQVASSSDPLPVPAGMGDAVVMPAPSSSPSEVSGAMPKASAAVSPVSMPSVSMPPVSTGSIPPADTAMPPPASTDSAPMPTVMPLPEPPPPGGVGKTAIGKSPNILFVIVDDQSPWDLKVYNPTSKQDTPVIDRLAAQGMVLDGAYHMGASIGGVCTPSRHMVMSGRTVWHVPVRGTQSTIDPDRLANTSMAAVFNDAGYATMRTCKAGNSFLEANAKFQVRHDANKREGNDANGSAWHAERVLDYLGEREAQQDKRPFLIYLGFSHPHDTRDGKPELLQKYGATNHRNQNQLPQPTDAAPDLPKNWLDKHPFNHGHNNVRDEVRVEGVWDKRDPQTIRNELGREFACNENIDIQLGRVLDRLEASGELENTYIVYTSDHGMAIGRHGLQGKQNLYEHTWRVPFIVSGPGIVPGRAQANIYLTDVLGTLCELAGIEPPATNEGMSFVPVLDRSKETMRDDLYGAYAGGAKPGIRAVRQGDWKLIKYQHGNVRRTQLFNLKENPLELIQEHQAVVNRIGIQPTPNQVNLANDPQHAEKLAELEALLRRRAQELDDPFPLAAR